MLGTSTYYGDAAGRKDMHVRRRLAAAALLLASSSVPAADSLGDSDALPHHRALLGGPPAPVPIAGGTPQWTGPGASPTPRSNAKLAAEHARGAPPAPVPVAAQGGAEIADCRRIQHASWKGSWNSVPSADQALWKSAKVRRAAHSPPRPRSPRAVALRLKASGLCVRACARSARPSCACAPSRARSAPARAFRRT